MRREPGRAGSRLSTARLIGSLATWQCGGQWRQHYYWLLLWPLPLLWPLLLLWLLPLPLVSLLAGTASRAALRRPGCCR